MACDYWPVHFLVRYTVMYCTLIFMSSVITDQKYLLFLFTINYGLKYMPYVIFYYYYSFFNNVLDVHGGVVTFNFCCGIAVTGTVLVMTTRHISDCIM